MATHQYGRVFPASQAGDVITEKGSGVIGFGLLTRLKSDGIVQLQTGTGNPTLGIATPNEVLADINGAESFANGDPIAVETLVKGKIYWVQTAGSVAINTYVAPAAAGKVANPFATTTPSVYNIGVALEAGSGAVDSGWFKMKAL